MAHCPLYAGRRRRKPFGDLRIQHLRYSSDGARTADRKKDPCTQVLKAFNMRRYAHLVEDVRDGTFQMCGRGSRHLRRGGQSGDGGGRSRFRLRVLPQALQKRSGVAGLGDKICRAKPCALGNNGGVDKSGENDYRRRALRFGEPAQYAQPVEPRLNELQQHHIRPQRLDLRKGLRPAGRKACRFHISLLRKRSRYRSLEIRIRVGDQHAKFHNIASISIFSFS